MNSIISPRASGESDVVNSQKNRMHDPWYKAIEDRNNLIKAREDQAYELKVSVQYLKDESLKINNKNERILDEFRKMISASDDELHAKTDELIQKISEMKNRLEEYRFESKAKWISFKCEYIHKMNELEKAVSSLVVSNHI